MAQVNGFLSPVWFLSSRFKGDIVKEKDQGGATMISKGKEWLWLKEWLQGLEACMPEKRQLVRNMVQTSKLRSGMERCA